ncbi:MAG: TAT-variant-translocated molybdopterin oxidoreductase [Cyclobacteriaceae bacterium]|nr:TAT-variant-translocated molybdopterin oxidoreductase [Cyclobacteriaceae bacterium]
MKGNRKIYWNGLEQLSNDPEFVKHADREFPEELPLPGDAEKANSGTRRDFLKMMGFSVAAASLAACEAPVRKAIPYLNKPVDVDPGIPNFYASTYMMGGDYCSIVVKTREGRPIKITGNHLSGVTKGKTNAQVEASILSLYDIEKLNGPIFDGVKSEWSIIDKDIIEQLKAISLRGGQIRLISHTILSPATQSVIDTFLTKYPNARHITYDAISYRGITQANKSNFGLEVIPGYDFSKAEVVVSFGADFLGTWLQPIRFSHDYARLRKVSRENRHMSRHYQYEGLMSLTGANADYRIPVKPSSEGFVVGKLYNILAARAGYQTLDIQDPGDVKFLTKAADNLWSSRGRSLVVSGSNDPAIQELVNGINSMLGNYGKTIDLLTPLNMWRGKDEEMDEFIQEATAGRIQAVIFYNANPVYNHPRGEALSQALEGVELVVSTSDRIDETASLAKYVAPDHHFLESWNDSEPVPGHLSLGQPTITPIFNTRQAQDSFLVWSEAAESTDYYQFLRKTWEENYFNRQNKINDFQRFWDQSLFDGVFTYEADNLTPGELAIDPGRIASAINRNYMPENKGLELILYQKVGIGDGTQANNPWLQEMPDPITKVVWDNYLTVSVKDAAEMGITTESNEFTLANLGIFDQTLTLPVVIQPGQAKGTLGLALGYGRERAGKVADGIGVNAFRFISQADDHWSFYQLDGITLEALDDRYELAQTQTHHTFMSRSNVIQDAYLSQYQADPGAGRFIPKIYTTTHLEKKLGEEDLDGVVHPHAISLWNEHEYPNHHWGMVIDLNSCIGCGSCTIACQVENNVPVVGREEVRNRRDMHWIRIDRYYSSEAPMDDWSGLEEAAENPEVTFQPMLCQHCNHAPCETVCPVVATTHSTEGLNQMTYNRCIGTRYCANNCPYKVRRFNWFKYHDNSQFNVNLSMSNSLGKMVLNPDVVVRSRGVMEKCTFCIQRIQLGKLEAKKEGRRPVDADINTACAEACPADAIVFGDMNDQDSRISKMLRLNYRDNEKIVQEERAYHVLEEVGARPNIFYYTKIRNKDIEDLNA